MSADDPSSYRVAARRAPRPFSAPRHARNLVGLPILVLISCAVGLRSCPHRPGEPWKEAYRRLLTRDAVRELRTSGHARWITALSSIGVIAAFLLAEMRLPDERIALGAAAVLMLAVNSGREEHQAFAESWSEAAALLLSFSCVAATMQHAPIFATLADCLPQWGQSRLAVSAALLGLTAGGEGGTRIVVHALSQLPGVNAQAISGLASGITAGSCMSLMSSSGGPAAYFVTRLYGGQLSPRVFAAVGAPFGLIVLAVSIVWSV